jgi:hypothetical protein
VRTGQTRIASFLCVASLCVTGNAAAQGMTPPAPPARSDGWNTATNILAVSSLALQAVLPRVFLSDPEVTSGWKARWHMSVLAPVMTLTTLAFLNEQVLKSGFGASQPGCTSDTQGQAGCTSYGFLSTQSFAAASALGQGAGVFLADTIRWSGGSINAGSLIGQVGVPLVLAPVTIIGRTEGNWESAGQAWGSAAIGLAIGLGVGFLYASVQRPECGYTGNLLCW